MTFLARDLAHLEHEADDDLVYAQLFLTHLRDPVGALQRMAQATKPGGVVEDMDHAGVFCYPASPALTHHVSLYNRHVGLQGADPEIGPKPPALFREVGLHDLHLSHVQPAFMAGDAKRVHQITLKNIAPAVIAAGLATEAEIKAMIAALDNFAQDPQTIVSFPRSTASRPSPKRTSPRTSNGSTCRR